MITRLRITDDLFMKEVIGVAKVHTALPDNEIKQRLIGLLRL